MSTYLIKMSVTVDVEIEVQATSQTSVRTLIDKNLIMTAGLVDATSVPYNVIEDSITDIEIQDVEKL